MPVILSLSGSSHRLGRSMRHLVSMTEELRQRGVNFRSLTDSIDTSTPMGRFFFHIMGALAEMERELIVERTRAGLDAARAQGRIGGRRPKLTPDEMGLGWPVDCGRRVPAARRTDF